MTSTQSGGNLISEENLRSTQSHSFLKEEENKTDLVSSRVFFSKLSLPFPHMYVLTHYIAKIEVDIWPLKIIPLLAICPLVSFVLKEKDYYFL